MTSWQLPPTVEEALWQAARDRLPAAALARGALRDAVIARSRVYTSERELLDEVPPTAAADLAARALFFTVADAAKPMFALAELAARGLLPARAPLRVLDLGAGCGAMSLGVWAALREAGDTRRIEVVAVDRDAEALGIFADAARLVDPDLAVEKRVADLAGLQAAPGTVDLVVSGTTLNELAPADRQSLVTAAVRAIGDDGAVLLIEPALRETARALHELRDWVIDSGTAHVFAPCTRTRTPCPALADADDWCHEDRPTQLPSRAAAMSRDTGLRRYGLKLSYLTLLRQPATQVDADGALVPLRVVSQPRKLKGRFQLIACGDGGRLPMRLLKRNRGPDNRSFERAARGDVLLCRETGEVARDDQVRLHAVDLG